jgi:ABC-type cobalamin/Fe3+-siderophores transport system ATPase subunit
LTDPAIIYLDEPTSGLDPNLEVSATYLLAAWEQLFSDRTQSGLFTLLDGARVEVPLMFRQGGFR